MSLYCLACRCSGAEPRIRQFLRANHYDNWQSIPVIKGREACLSRLSLLPDTPALAQAKDTIKRSSSWSIIIGTDGTTYEWGNLSHAKLKEKLDLEMLVERYK